MSSKQFLVLWFNLQRGIHLCRCCGVLFKLHGHFETTLENQFATDKLAQLSCEIQVQYGYSSLLIRWSDEEAAENQEWTVDYIEETIKQVWIKNERYEERRQWVQTVRLDLERICRFGIAERANRDGT